MSKPKYKIGDRLLCQTWMSGNHLDEVTLIIIDFLQKDGEWNYVYSIFEENGFIRQKSMSFPVKFIDKPTSSKYRINLLNGDSNDTLKGML